MVVASIVFGFVLLIRKTCKGFEFWGKIPKVLVKKLTPFLFSMTFEMVLMEVVLGFALGVVYYQGGTVVSDVSIAFMVIVGMAVLLSFFWKVEDDQGLIHYGLLYNYEIKYDSNQK